MPAEQQHLHHILLSCQYSVVLVSSVHFLYCSGWQCLLSSLWWPNCMLLHVGSNVVSVAEHVVMMMLSLVRNYMPAHKQIVDGGWNVAEIARK